MQTIGFSHTKLAMRIFGCTLGVMLMVFVAVTAQSGIIPLVLAVFFAGFGGLCMLAIMTGRPALELDDRGMTLNNLLTSRTVAWSDVADVNVHTMTLYFLGFIPAARHGHLIIKTTGSWVSGNKVRVSTRMMDLPPGGHEGLLALIEAARRSAAGGAAVRAGCSALETAQAGSQFDSDAAIARYIARTTEGADAAALLQRPTFGRKQV